MADRQSHRNLSPSLRMSSTPLNRRVLLDGQHRPRENDNNGLVDRKSPLPSESGSSFPVNNDHLENSQVERLPRTKWVTTVSRRVTSPFPRKDSTGHNDQPFPVRNPVEEDDHSSTFYETVTQQGGEDLKIRLK